MAWGLIINGIPLLRINRDSLESSLEDSERMIEFYKDDIKVLAFGSPRDVTQEEGNVCPWEEYAPRQLREALEGLEEEVWKRNLVQYALNNPEDVKDY